MLHQNLSLFVFLGIGAQALSVALTTLLLYLWNEEDRVGSIHFSTDYYVAIAVGLVLAIIIFSASQLFKAQRFMRAFSKKKDPKAYKFTMDYLSKFWKLQGILAFIFLLHFLLLVLGFNGFGLHLPG